MVTAANRVKELLPMFALNSGILIVKGALLSFFRYRSLLGTGHMTGKGKRGSANNLK